MKMKNLKTFRESTMFDNDEDKLWREITLSEARQLGETYKEDNFSKEEMNSIRILAVESLPESSIESRGNKIYPTGWLIPKDSNICMYLDKDYKIRLDLRKLEDERFLVTKDVISRYREIMPGVNSYIPPDTKKFECDGFEGLIGALKYIFKDGNLKTFKESTMFFDEDKLWKEINLNEWIDFMDRERKLFNQSEVDQLKKYIFNTVKRSADIEVTYTNEGGKRLIWSIKFSNRKKLVWIYKFDDEWFGVEVNYINKEDFFICDTIEGLFDLLKTL